MVEHKFPCKNWTEKGSCDKCSQIADDIKFMDVEEKKLYFKTLNETKTHEVELIIEKLSLQGTYKDPIPRIILDCIANGQSFEESRELTDEVYQIIRNQMNVKNVKITLSWDDKK